MADIEAMENGQPVTESARRYRILRVDALSPGLRRIVIGLIGATTLLFGIAMIAVPGPAIVVIPLGLGILGTEFAWARRLIQKAGGALPRRKQ